MTLNAQFPEGATPIDPDEAAGLKPGLTTLAELNAFEQINIAQAVYWAKRSRTLKKSLLEINSLKKLHQRMFNETWRWAGTFRTTGKNIGVEPYLIQTQLGNLCADAIYWGEHKVFDHQIAAIRFHHRLVSIHPFPNGNGRHARLVADLMMYFAGDSAFTWGGSSIDVQSATRTDYLTALRMADKGDYALLMEFATRK